MISNKRLAFLAAATTFCAIGWTSVGAAQIVYPVPYRYAGSPDSSVRLEVTPRDAEVYVDGYYAGIVDDFDGVFQRLRVVPGPHEITIYREGFHAARQSMYLAPDRTFKIKQHLEPLAPGEAADVRPVPATPAPGTQAPFPQQPRGGRRGGPNNYPPSNYPPPNPPGSTSAPPPPAQEGTGRLTIQLRPSDAEVDVDGQPLSIPQGQTSVDVEVVEGRHVVQVRKQGYVGYMIEVDVRRGETTPLNVALRTQP